MKLYKIFSKNNRKITLVCSYDEQTKEFTPEGAMVTERGQRPIDISEIIPESWMESVDWVKILEEEKQLAMEANFD